MEDSDDVRFIYSWYFREGNFRVYNVGVIFFHAILEWFKNCDVKKNSVQRVVKVSSI